ncbi:hypothetical protein GDO86_002762 [Hymenochirus boettgeri]|uniref:Fibronectin type-III domain-containing protein n=1 Tax=Hymenochirus boettgeri TaxID=247094 RepID=A0A8T2JYA5_9PIPI|nr:hypothetical protein GDO86_002762 [Hymenochirus boettgeri]
MVPDPEHSVPVPFLLLVILLPPPADALSALPAPSNVHISSYNFVQKLLWDPVKVGNVTYTVEYKPNSEGEDEYYALFKNLKETVCDFTDVIKHKWNVVLRVRAELGALKSNWSQTSGFQATKNTILGPVNFLSLSTRESEPNALYVRFHSPLAGKSIGMDWRIWYLLQFWRNGSTMKAHRWTNSELEKLSDLEPSSVYCVEVTAYGTNITGQTCRPVCEKTSAAQAFTRSGYILLSLGLIYMCCTLVGFSFIIYKYHRWIKIWLYPPFTIPTHIQQYLQDPPQKGYVDETRAVEELFDTISIAETESLQNRVDPCDVGIQKRDPEWEPVSPHHGPLLLPVST